MLRQPLVSIIVNCFNGEEYLREALDSIITQTYKNWEIIFWDNQSNDTSAKIFKSYQDNRLKYYLAPSHAKILYEARSIDFAYESPPQQSSMQAAIPTSTDTVHGERKF